MSTETASTPSRFCPLCEQRLDAEVCPVDGVQTVRVADPNLGSDPALGRTLGGRYRIERVLGEGAMGRVYAATQLSLGLEVAVKLLHPHHEQRSPEIWQRQVQRFYREARAATRLTSQHVVRVTDFGVDDTTRAPYLVMELLRGETLAEHLARRGPKDPREAARLGAQIARALVDAHGSGLVHRDLKPANIMRVVTGDGTELLKVTDFGVAKDLLVSESTGLTAHGAAIGTPAYMAPEQVQGLDIDHRVDLYALGCILYELLTGERPYPAVSRADQLLGHLLVPAPELPLTLRGLPVPAILIGLVRSLLAKDRAARPSDAMDVVKVLEAIAQGHDAPRLEPPSAPRLPEGPRPSSAPPRATATRDPAPSHRASPRPPPSNPPPPRPSPASSPPEPAEEPTLLGRLWDWVRRRQVSPADRLRSEARKRRRRWLRHKSLYVRVNVGLFALNLAVLATSGNAELFAFPVLVFWGVGLLFHRFGYRAWLRENQPLFELHKIDPDQPDPSPSTSPPSRPPSPEKGTQSGLGTQAQPALSPQWEQLVTRCRRAVEAARRALVEQNPAAGTDEIEARLGSGLADIVRLARGGARLETLLAELAPEVGSGPAALRSLEQTLAATTDPKLREVYEGHRALLRAREERLAQLRSELTRIRATIEGFILAVENVRLDLARKGSPTIHNASSNLRDFLRKLDDELDVLASVEVELDGLAHL